jgi:hypothetical protein
MKLYLIKGVIQMRTNLILGIVLSLFLFNLSFAQKGRNIHSNNKNEVVTIKGSVVSINHPIAVIKGDDGKSYELRLGPSWYWKQNKLEIKEKGNIEVKGELEKSNDKFFIYPNSIIQDGKTITLTDNNGKPLWAGNGKNKEKGMGGSHGKGMKNMHDNGKCKESCDTENQSCGKMKGCGKN